ncbi:hypothetical protein [Streptomyces hirsutus]|uniref:hypothetical protein n=1 Tax=Streptomyces hirsutus TaxID=35620 RepID=UPI0006E139B4|nr:hypothetical protein [Streptomyces hirsutus]
MRQLIRQLVGWTRPFLAPTGRHRAERLSPQGRRPETYRPVMVRSAVSRSALSPAVRCWYAPIDGTSTTLVRPYLAAHERDEKVRVQRLRRDILWCATYGVDLDMRDIHAGLGAAS